MLWNYTLPILCLLNVCRLITDTPQLPWVIITCSFTITGIMSGEPKLLKMTDLHKWYPIHVLKSDATHFELTYNCQQAYDRYTTVSRVIICRPVTIVSIMTPPFDNDRLTHFNLIYTLNHNATHFALTYCQQAYDRYTKASLCHHLSSGLSSVVQSLSSTSWTPPSDNDRLNTL